MTPLGKYIRTLRDKKELSLREFATELRKTAAFISDVELGRRYPSEEVLADMAKVLGTTVEDLKKHDFRPPVDEIRRITASNPQIAVAFRNAVDNVPAEKLQKALEQLVEARSEKKRRPG
jgi:transcriptional regulator with XRE-family HTH domain